MRKLALFTVVLAFALPAAAQDFSPPTTPGWESLPLQREVLGNALRRSTRRSKQRKTTGVLRPAPAPSGKAAAVATRYRPSAEVSARVRRQFVAWVRSMSPAEAAQLEKEFQVRDYTRVWAEIVKDDGMRPGDVADALASYWVLNWVIATGRTSDDNAAYVPAVRAQTLGVLASDPGFSKLNEAQRQEMAEALMLNFVVQYAAIRDAYKRGDETMKRRLAEAAVSRFRNEMGLDLRRLQLGRDGFVSG